MKIALCASEAVPFAKTGGLADVCGALPEELGALGHEVILVMPKYPSVKSAGFLTKSVSDDFEVASISQHVKAYFLSHDMYLRGNLYGDRFGDYPDNLNRFAYFCRKSLELFETIDFVPDCVHCHDWQTSLIPVYLKSRGKDIFKDSPVPASVLTIHNLAYQGLFPKEKMPETGLGWDYFTMDGLEYFDKINLLKGGILFSDAINTVSPTYAREVQTKEFGCGLEGVLAQRQERFSGILNGVDYKVWNPQADSALEKNYTVKNPEDKAADKRKLQEVCGFPLDPAVFLLGFVGRLVEQKGIDLILKVLPECVRLGMQAVILGVGDPEHEQRAVDLAQKFPRNIFYSSRFDEVLARRIYAGSDAFLMPSRFEPCGIGQLISFKYGTIPVVYKTGGLGDTVIDYRHNPKFGTGFVFTRPQGKDFLAAIEAARALFEDGKKWLDLMKRVMKLNFSWKESAREYVRLYEKAKRSSRLKV
ncbi:MAG: glycogen synthase GlgA [Candidatus Omnitrophota bacterium]